jgi:hypothetical protein
MPERLVLEGVPYIGEDWTRGIGGPEDFMLPASMRSLTWFLGGPREEEFHFYLAVTGMATSQLWHPTEWNSAFDDNFRMSADPVEPIRRAFEAAGYEFTLLVNRQVWEERKYPAHAFDRYSDQDEMRQAVCASIQAGKPAIAFGLLSSAAIVAGYDDGGQTLLGWSMADEKTAEHDPSGYLRMRDWLKSTPAVAIVGEKREKLSRRDVCRKALLWIVEGARTPKVGDFASGLAAFDAWAKALERDEELRLDDLDLLKQRHQAHFFASLTTAEGRAYTDTLMEMAMAAEPTTEPELGPARDGYEVMHDLVWRLWQTEGEGTDDQKLRRFTDPAVRRELARIILEMRDQDARAAAHIARALEAFGVKPEEIPPPSEAEATVVARAEARVRASGGDRTRLMHGGPGVGVWVVGVPMIGWMRGKDCGFAGALEGATASTAYPCSYPDIMGYSGLAFRTRWFHNPGYAETAWGTGRWHPVGPHGEGPDELAALERTTGWRFRTETLPKPGEDDVKREHLITDIFLSVREGLPVLVTSNTDMALAYGYDCWAPVLLLRDYQRPDQDALRVPTTDANLAGPMVFLNGLGQPTPPKEAFLQSLALAARNARREPAEGFRYGLDALQTWADDLGGWNTYDEGERSLLALANWWTLMHLADARAAAVQFLESNADLVTGDSLTALQRAIDLYRQEADLLKAFADDNSGFLPWRGGTSGVADWTDALRQRQQDMLSQARSLEEQALTALAAVGP